MEANKALAYRVYEAINAQNIEALDELFDAHIVRHAMGEAGIEKAREAALKAFATLSDKRFVVEDVLAEGDKVALRVTIHGIPTLPDQPLPTILEIFRVENGRVAEIWGAGTLQQPS
jgi:predicted ester cyclase